MEGEPQHTQTGEAESRLLHALFDRLPAMIAYWDRDKRNVIANHAYVEWFGLTPEEMRGIHIREVLGEDVYAMNLPFMEGALAGEEQLFDRTLVDTSGRTRHTQASYVPDIVDGEVRGFFVLVTDVTPRVEAQRAMDEAQSLARLGSWSMVVETGQITWSDELFRIFGVDRDGFAPSLETLTSMVHPEDAARAAEVRERAMRDRVEYVSEYRICRPDGTVREVRSLGRPVLDATGAVVRLTGTLQDITEANEAIRRIALINDELVQLNQLNADVIGMLGHDVRAPLAVVLGYLEELDSDWEQTPDELRRSHVAKVRTAAVRLRGLIDDILAMATLDSGALVARIETHGLGALVRAALDEVPEQPEVRLELDADVDVRCDPFHVRQIVANLVLNAQRYGVPPLTVVVGGTDEFGTVTVTDRGPGVPAEFVPRIFERFAPGPGTGRGSTGFGLYIAARLARANGGSLSYQPLPREPGARFVLSLPRA